MKIFLRYISIPLSLSILFFLFIDENFFAIFRKYITKIFQLNISILEYKIFGSLLIFLIYIIFDIIISIDTSSKKSITYGSARWATAKELASLNKGILIGKVHGRLIRTQYNAFICAPSRSGKGVSSIITNLLDHTGSAIILDIKGENFAVTARERQKYGKVFVLDPFNVMTEKSHSLNILDHINFNNNDYMSQSETITDMICDTDKKEYFEKAAKKLIQGLILYASYKSIEPEKKNIISVRKFLNLETTLLIKILEDMYTIDQISGCAVAALESYTNGSLKEFSGVVNTARTLTNFLDDPRMEFVLSNSDFNFEKIKKEIFSVYIIIPPKYLDMCKSYIRTIFTIALNAVMADSTQPAEKVLFLLDEFPQLGLMKEFEKAISVISGYGGQFLIYAQNLSQVDKIYGDSETFLSNSDSIFFGCNDLRTANYISERLGKMTLRMPNEKNRAQISEAPRDLLTAEEVLNLKKNKMILFSTKSRPALVDKIEYHNEKLYKNRFDKNPFIK